MSNEFAWLKIGGMTACALALLSVSEHFRKSVGPLRQRETEALREAAELRKRIGGAQDVIAENRARKSDAARIQEQNDSAQAGLPPGKAIVSFPEWMKEHFVRSGLAMPVIRMNAAEDEPNASGYERGFWSVDLPLGGTGRDVSKLLESIADLDGRYVFVRILDFELRADPEKPGVRVGKMNLATVLRK